ncbi:hypothetical protein [Campylobacter lanienae]|nr:hypothetical protein [Campylobacter lanienae]MDD5785758.1 hypothetical protein [Campylobacter lanienae]
MKLSFTFSSALIVVPPTSIEPFGPIVTAASPAPRLPTAILMF